MTCYYPNEAHIDGLNTNGNKLIRFGKAKKTGCESLLLPCGQCIGCRLDKSITWAARCMHESQMHDTSQFITLTYDEENLPHYGSLCPPHFVNFMKRYRKSIEPNKIRFFHGAEYGDEIGRRPHHHACIFGHEFTDLEIFRECEGLITYYSPTLEKLWGKGFATTAELTLESAAYVARYNLKKVNGDKKDAHYETICQTTGEIRQLLPEYSTMSRGDNKTSGGIGKEWYNKFNSDIFPHDTTIYKGKNIKTPRYYENILRSTDSIMYEDIKNKRKIKALKQQHNNTPERLKVREIIKLASIQNLTRNLHNDS